MAREVRPPFDPTQDFYVTRPLQADRSYLVDELFDKTVVEPRRLRQMYEHRMLRQETAKPVETSVDAPPVVQRARYRNNAA